MRNDKQKKKKKEMNKHLRIGRVDVEYNRVIEGKIRLNK